MTTKIGSVSFPDDAPTFGSATLLAMSAAEKNQRNTLLKLITPMLTAPDWSSASCRIRWPTLGEYEDKALYSEMFGGPTGRERTARKIAYLLAAIWRTGAQGRNLVLKLFTPVNTARKVDLAPTVTAVAPKAGPRWELRKTLAQQHPLRLRFSPRYSNWVVWVYSEQDVYGPATSVGTPQEGAAWTMNAAEGWGANR